MNLVDKAREFAIQAHESVGQIRKYTGAPYYTHVLAVAEIVSTIPGHTKEMVAAAYLHDTVEDTPITLDEIEENFGETVAQYVFYLTNTKDRAINRKARKAIDIERLKKAPSVVKSIKCADIIHNCGSITEHDPGFAKRYLNEGLDLLTNALTGANGPIWSYAVSVVKGNLDILTNYK